VGVCGCVCVCVCVPNTSLGRMVRVCGSTPSCEQRPCGACLCHWGGRHRVGWLSQVVRLGSGAVRAARDGRMCIAGSAWMCYCPCYMHVWVGGTMCFIGIECVRVRGPVRANGTLTEDPPRPHMCCVCLVCLRSANTCLSVGVAPAGVISGCGLSCLRWPWSRQWLQPPLSLDRASGAASPAGNTSHDVKVPSLQFGCLYLQTQRGSFANFGGPKTGTPCPLDPATYL
jgi:hypothetical protein